MPGGLRYLDQLEVAGPIDATGDITSLAVIMGDTLDATDTATTRGNLDFVSSATYYVDDGGDDTWLGTSPGTPRKTIASGIGLLGSSDALSIARGVYSESFTVPDDTYIDGPSVRVNGELVYGDGSVVDLFRLSVADGDQGLTKTNVGNSNLDIDRISCSGAGSALLDAQNGSSTFLSCDLLTLATGTGIESTNGSQITASLGVIEGSGACTALEVDSGGRIEAICEKIEVPSGSALVVGASSEIDVKANRRVRGSVAWSVLNGGTLRVAAFLIQGTGSLVGSGTCESQGRQNGDVTLTGTSVWVHYGGVTGDIDCGDGCTVIIHGDVVGDIETNTSGTVQVYGSVTGTASGSGTLQVISTGLREMWAGAGTTRTVNGYNILLTDRDPHDIDTTGGVVDLVLPTAADWLEANPDLPFIRVGWLVGANQASVTPQAGESINLGVAGAAKNFGVVEESWDLYAIPGVGYQIR